METNKTTFEIADEAGDFAVLDKWLEESPWARFWSDLKTWLDNRRQKKECFVSAQEVIAKIKELAPATPGGNKEEADVETRIAFFRDEYLSKTDLPLDVRIILLRMNRLERSIQNGIQQKNVPLF